METVIVISMSISGLYLIDASVFPLRWIRKKKIEREKQEADKRKTRYARKKSLAPLRKKSVPVKQLKKDEKQAQNKNEEKQVFAEALEKNEKRRAKTSTIR